jgi:ubiquinone/menaquinone biosynthesis C-methylase UbiE
VGTSDGLPAPPVSFDRVAGEYEATRYLPRPVADAVARRVVSGVPAAQWVLDAGVGTGRLGRSLAGLHPRTVGVDVSRQMMREMLRLAGGGDGNTADAAAMCLAQADLRALPFPDGAFAAVLAAHVFHLIGDWERALDEVWRVLRPEGSLFVSVESRVRTEVREFYLQRAAAMGMLPATPGAHSSDLLAALRNRYGAALSEEGDAPDLSWAQTLSARQTLAMLERRTYSILWDLPEPVHRQLLQETARWVVRRLGSLDATETVHTQLVLYRARKR